jgi:hypothetical protein
LKGSGKLGWRVDKAEQRLGTASKESEVETEKRQEMIRETAEQANERGYGQEFGCHPLFTIHEDGTVTSNVDGKRITTPHQTLAERFYWLEVERPVRGLDHDRESQAFYLADGRLALSRNYARISALVGGGGRG